MTHNKALQKPSAHSATKEFLLSEYKTHLIPLGSISKRYLGLSEKKAREKYHAGGLPFPVAALMPSRKAPLFVRVDDLASYIESRFDRAKLTLGRQ